MGFSINDVNKLTFKVQAGGVIDADSNARWYESKLSFSPNVKSPTRILTDYNFKGHPLRKDFPLTGFNEVRYSEKDKKVIYEPVKLEQNYRNFDFESPWEGTNYIKEIKNSDKDGKKN